MPAPKAYEVRVSCAPFVPISIVKQTTSSQVCPRPNPASFVASFNLPANAALITNRKNKKKQETIAGIASFRKLVIISTIVSSFCAVSTTLSDEDWSEKRLVSGFFWTFF